MNCTAERHLPWVSCCCGKGNSATPPCLKHPWRGPQHLQHCPVHSENELGIQIHCVVSGQNCSADPPFLGITGILRSGPGLSYSGSGGGKPVPAPSREFLFLPIPVGLHRAVLCSSPSASTDCCCLLHMVHPEIFFFFLVSAPSHEALGASPCQ